MASLASIVAPAAWAAAPLCPGDQWVNRQVVTLPIDQATLEIRANSRIVHQANHPNCAHGGNAAPIGAEAELLGGFFTNCRTGIHSATHLEQWGASARRECSDLGEGCYNSRGSHYYNNVFDRYTFGNQRCITGGAGGGLCVFGGCGCCSAPGWTNNPSRCRDPEEQDVCGCCRRSMTPLLIDRSGNGMTVSSAKNGALFKIDGPKADDVWVGWPETADDAWLALDRNGNGAIDDGSELFGSATPLSSGGLADDGYQALAELDENGDHWVNEQDPAFGSLTVWADANRNGVSEPREILTLAAAGITALSLDYWGSLYEDPNGNAFQYCAETAAFPLPGDAPTIERLSCDVYPDIESAVP